jgi:thiosulfate/3-mercaptopyruvate sulfurtransferase
MRSEEEMTSPSLVTPEWLSERLGAPGIRVVDTRWYLMEPARGEAEYREAHIPGAVYMDMERDLAAPKGHGPGRHPLPQPEAFASSAGRAGIGPETLVVAYDSSGGAAAARLWWLLRYYGHAQFALLDGGWQAWLAAGLPSEAGVAQAPPAQFVAQPRRELVVDAAQVDAIRQATGALLIDARAGERYVGAVEPIDPRAGHIPGAVSAPFAGNLGADGRFLPPEALRARFAALGAERAQPLVCYCGSGVTAAHNLLALELAGITGGLLYEGSWSDWSSDPARPAATGSEP